MLERAVFAAWRTLGRLLRGSRYATVSVRTHEVHKRRLWYAPLLVRLGEPLVLLLGTGVRVLRQRAWEERERVMYRTLYGADVRVEHGALVLPRLPGRILADLVHEDARRDEVIAHAVDALVALHRRDITHGDAMAENVLVDCDAGVARWFDFETAHDPARSTTWRRADDVRALLATVLLRTPDPARAGVLQRMLDRYADRDVERELAAMFRPRPRRVLAFHLGQAALSFDEYRAIGRLLRQRA